MLSDPIALGIVPDEGRGSLPFALLYGEPLIAAATFALEAADVTVLDPRTQWSDVIDTSLPLVLHDPLCPLIPASFLAEALETSLQADAVVVGMRPVTDTIKEDRGDRLGATIDRATLREVASPIVVPARVLAELPGLPSGDFAEILVDLQRFGVTELAAPAVARRVRAREDIALLEAMGRPLVAE